MFINQQLLAPLPKRKQSFCEGAVINQSEIFEWNPIRIRGRVMPEPAHSTWLLDGGKGKKQLFEALKWRALFGTRSLCSFFLLHKCFHVTGCRWKTEKSFTKLIRNFYLITENICFHSKRSNINRNLISWWIRWIVFFFWLNISVTFKFIIYCNI